MENSNRDKNIHMENSIKKFLEFNEKKIYFLTVDGTWWIAIKPICEALGVDYEAQRKNLQNDKILSQLPSDQTVVAADGKLRKMLCLPEFFVYGWIFTIQSNSSLLEEYKWKCYELLFNYFHGTITGSDKIFKVKTKAEMELEQAENDLQKTDAYKKIASLKKVIQESSKEIKKQQKEYVKKQLPLWQTDPEFIQPFTDNNQHVQSKQTVIENY
jgi:hypothetical protein